MKGPGTDSNRSGWKCPVRETNFSLRDAVNEILPNEKGLRAEGFFTNMLADEGTKTREDLCIHSEHAPEMVILCSRAEGIPRYSDFVMRKIPVQSPLLSDVSR